MAEHRFTPGPWELDAPGNEHVVDYDYHVIQAGDGFHNTRNDQGFRLSGHMSIANARLIAAAPDLLQSLQTLRDKTAELVAHLKATDRLRPCFNLPALDAARAVITKATGG